MTNTTTANAVIDSLRWRYATKQFDPTKKIPADTWKLIEEALILSPSSWGIQPYRFVVVTNPDVKEKLASASWGQRQPADCSHLVVFCRQTKVDESMVSRYMERTAEVRGVPLESLNEFKKMIVGSFSGKSQEALADWATKQAYIALGNLMTAAACLHVDNCPMEGFVSEQYDEILGLKAKGISSVVLCALGYRAENDKYASLAKVRFPAAELIVHI